ncbi:MAG: hypothetical protein JRI59_09575 [Deltaproteobacteria bacterium]|nr:hypothetical protein [Deltaproteobacteria bacterium]
MLYVGENLAVICILGFFLILGLGFLLYYFLASPVRPRFGKPGNKARSEAIFKVFARHYKQGKINQEQLEDLLRKYPPKK